MASLLLSFLFIVLVFYFLPFHELIEDLKKIDLLTFFLAFLLYTLSQITRSLKWSILLKIPFKESFFLNSANLFLNNILPARSGELSWFYYTKRLGIELKYSLWGFFIGRIYDMMGLFAVVSFSYLWVKFGILQALSFLALLIIFSPFFQKVIFLIPKFWKFKEIKNFLIREFSPKLSFFLFSISVVSFFLKAVSTYLIVSSVSNVDLFIYTLGFLGGELSSVLPIHGFMGYGTYEAGFLIPLKVIGIEIKEGLKMGFLAHNFLLFSSAIWGILSIFYLQIFSRKAP
ncbi:MAG TPA: UPF0104 family protein [Aquifex aeolicus]|nr:UPF0104 family protein [Aquifex aeolicus]